jgi:hypothetical protein
MVTAALTVFFLLIAGHYVVDFGLHSDWVARNKARKVGVGVWGHVLTAHASMQGLSVYLATQSLNLAVAELVAHWLIDFSKCEGKLSFHQDQLLHVVCRITWYVIYLTT